MKAHNSVLLSLPGAKWIWLTLLACVWLLLPTPGHGQIVINEFLADNKTNAPLPDFPDYFPDYVELYNTSDVEVDLGAEGWRIGDMGTNVAFAAGIKVPAHGFLLVFCDGDTNTTSAFPHTGFGLSGTQGDAVVLYHNGLMVESNYFGIQAPDFAIGRVPDGNLVDAMVLNAPTPGTNNVTAALGNSTKLRINEWQSLGNIVGGTGRTTNDWIEIFNTDTNPVSLVGLLLTDDLGADLPSSDPDRVLKTNSFIGPKGFAVIFLIASPAKANDADELDHFSISSSGGDQIWLYSADRLTEIDHVVAAVNPIPERTEGRLPDGADFPNTNNIAFKLTNPSRGESNFGQIPEIVINEALAHVDPPLEDAIELHNPTATNVNVGYWWLSNNRDEPKKFQIPAGTVIPAGGFKVFYEYEFNNPATADEPFNLNSAHGGEVYLSKADDDGNLLGFRRGINFGASENGVSFGRWVTVVNKIVESVSTLETNVDIVPMATLSFGSSITRTDLPTSANIAAFRAGGGAINPYPKVGPVVISEIHYHPPDIISGEEILDNYFDEFIELYNMTSQDVPLFDPMIYVHEGDFYGDGRTNTWRLRGEVDYEFPTNVTIAANSRLLVVRFDPSDEATVNNFTNIFGIPGYPTSVKIFGPYRGKLSNGGATVTLYKPDPPQGPPLHNDERGFVPYIYVDSIKYNDKSPWSLTADGMGFSLQRLVAVDFGNDANNWKGDIPSPGRPNTQNNLNSPVITVHPNTGAGAVGGEVNLSVAATGSELSYRWQFNGIQINGATNAELHLTNLSTNQAGVYRAIVLNPAGVVYSTEATLSVVPNITDTLPPTVAITFPANNAKLFTGSITASGTARDNLSVAYVEIKLNDGEFQRAVGAGTWSKELTLIPGVNTISVRAVDVATNFSAVVSRSFTYTASSAINLTINGQGTVSGINFSAPLDAGKTYKLTAKPAPYWLFADWTGDVTSTSPTLTFTMQDGLEIVANFVPNPFYAAGGTYNGLFYETNGVRPESAGYFSMKLGTKGTFTAQLMLAGKKYPAKGTLDLGGRGSSVIERPGTTPLLVMWTNNIDGSDTISGIVSNAAWISPLSGDRLTAQQFLAPSAYAGRYTFVFPGNPESPTSPGGDSYGAIQVAPSGQVTITGSLSDDSKFTHKTTISKYGEIPLFFGPYAGKGVFMGWLNLAPAPTTNFTSAVAWVKSAAAGGALYPTGFSYSAELEGSSYVMRSSILDFAAGLFTLTGGDLAEPLSNEFTLLPGGKITSDGPNKLTLKFVPATGLFNGTVTPANTTTPIKFSGAVQQASTNGSGYFLGTDKSGRVTISPAP